MYENWIKFDFMMCCCELVVFVLHGFFSSAFFFLLLSAVVYHGQFRYYSYTTCIDSFVPSLLPCLPSSFSLLN